MPTTDLNVLVINDIKFGLIDLFNTLLSTAIMLTEYSCNCMQGEIFKRLSLESRM